MIGRMLGRYQIVEKLGAGGMGEVYRAEDTSLRRHVAIKVLPEEFARDAERLARFQREAQILASLSNPNIATLHGLEECDAKRFIVMELVQGQTLAQRLLRGPLPVEEALEVCRQIAEGLEAAHEKGVIHRDLKPGNVMVTPDNTVRILDFGLAKAFAAEPQPTEATHSPTITEAMTRAGTILGTAAYMSPEQAKGKAVDRRADIWAFGCILYECLTGKRAFEGETIPETLASLIKGEPEWSALPESTPEQLRRLLRRCLRKEPNLRLHDVADARIEIGEVIAHSSAIVTKAHRPNLRWLVACLSITTVAGLLTHIATRMYFPTNPEPVARVAIVLAPEEHLAGNDIAISPDGSHLAYVATRDGTSRIYLRAIDSLESGPVTGSEGGISPFFSPDSRSLGFFANGKLKRVFLSGGAPADVCDAPHANGASWGPSDLIVFGGSYSGVSGEGFSGLRIAPAGGGTPRILTTPDRTKGEVSHFQPEFLPNGSDVLFTIWKGSTAEIAVTSLKQGNSHTIIQDGAHPHFAPPGHLVFGRGDSLLAHVCGLSRPKRAKNRKHGLASPNHPYIATPHGPEESDGRRFIIMELAEDQTLAKHLL